MKKLATIRIAPSVARKSTLIKPLGKHGQLHGIGSQLLTEEQN
jgi:hypothetical protein